MNLFTELRQDWHATPPRQLLDAPPTALKAVDDARAAAMREVLGVETLRDMATQPLLDWVWRTFGLFRAGVQRDLPADAAEHVTADWQGRSCGEWAASTLGSLQGLSEADVQRLTDALGWVTVRHAATDKAFAVAREVHRLVTGEPVPPEEAVDKPPPDYFGGGTQRFLEREREAGRARPQTAPPPPPPPPAPARAPAEAAEAAPGAAAAPAAPSLPVEGEAPAAPHAGHGPWQATGLPDAPRRHHKDYTDDGTYIPKGGGSRGWVENQGVARIEQGNRYRYRDVVDVPRFRRSELEETVRVNNRGAERKEMRMQVRWAFDADTPPTPGLCLNLSITGAKLRVGLALKEDSAVHVTWVHRDELLGTETPVLALGGRVVWCHSVNPAYRKPRYDCGIQFDPVALPEQERLTLLLTDRVDELLRADEPQQAEAR